MSEHPLSGTGVSTSNPVHANLTAPGLVQHALARGEGRLSADGAFIALTGQHTGRSVQDKFVVDDPEVTNEIWWGRINQKMEPAKFSGLAEKVRGWLEFGVQTVWVVDPRTRSVEVHAPGCPIRELGADDELNGGDALPGLVSRVAAFFC